MILVNISVECTPPRSIGAIKQIEQLRVDVVAAKQAADQAQRLSVANELKNLELQTAVSAHEAKNAELSSALQLANEKIMEFAAQVSENFVFQTPIDSL